MPRQPGTLINNKEAHSAMSFTPMVDLRHSGQHGFIPDYRTYLANSAYVQRNVIPFLIEYPRGFDFMPDGPVYVATLKSLVETHAKTIDGLNGTISVTYIDNPVGASGEVQHDYSRTERAPSTPSFTWVERQGQPIRSFFDAWIFNLLGHPDTQTPMINSYAQNKDNYFDFLPDFNSMTMLFVEPDPFQRRVVEAWLVVNMMPKGSGEVNGKRDLPSAMSSREVTVEFTGMQMMSTGVRQFGQSLLDELNYVGLNPHNRRSAIESITANITDPTMPVVNNVGDTPANVKVGYLGQVDHVATTNHYMSAENEINSKVVHNPQWVLSEGSDRR